MSCNNSTALNDVQKLVSDLERDSRLLHEVVHSDELEIPVDNGSRKTLKGLLSYVDTTVTEEINAAFIDVNQAVNEAQTASSAAQDAADAAEAEADRAEAAADSIDTDRLEGLISAVGDDLDATKASLGTAAAKDFGNGANQIPDMSFFAALLTGQGYQKFPSGIIAQWGSQSSAEKTTTRATFPIPFPNACFKVIPIGGTAAGGVHATVAYNVADKNGFTFNAFSGASGSPSVLASANGVIGHYLALGW